ncbi:MAG: response regulator, partial [Proteobacteria bacterium]|nr:response regulator [Pseudomonadota bacterium]
MIAVLLVDDSRLVRTVLREILEADPEIRVVGEADNGLEGVEKCVSLAPDVVLMDVQMPVMDGLEAVERIMRERPTPVIVLSATVNPGEVGSAFRAVRAGAFEALPKPE